MQQKQTAWEGGIRTPAIIYAPFLPQGVIRSKYFYIADFLPTLLTLSNSNVQVKTPIDGMDLSKMLLNEMPPFRNEVLTIDDIFGYSSYIQGDFKLVNGSSSENSVADRWLGSNNNTNVNAFCYMKNVLQSSAAKALYYPLRARKILGLRKRATVRCRNFRPNECDLLKGPCLFNIISDPCEKVNLAASESKLMSEMVESFNNHLKTVAPSLRMPADPNCNPKFFNYTWTHWADYPPNVS